MDSEKRKSAGMVVTVVVGSLLLSPTRTYATPTGSGTLEKAKRTTRKLEKKVSTVAAEEARDREKYEKARGNTKNPKKIGNLHGKLIKHRRLGYEHEDQAREHHTTGSPEETIRYHKEKSDYHKSQADQYKQQLDREIVPKGTAARPDNTGGNSRSWGGTGGNTGGGTGGNPHTGGTGGNTGGGR